MFSDETDARTRFRRNADLVQQAQTVASSPVAMPAVPSMAMAVGVVGILGSLAMLLNAMVWLILVSGRIQTYVFLKKALAGHRVRFTAHQGPFLQAALASYRVHLGYSIRSAVAGRADSANSRRTSCVVAALIAQHRGRRVEPTA